MHTPSDWTQKKYRGQVLIKPFVIASQSIENIVNNDWTAGVKSLLPNGTSVPSGAILAIGAEKSFDTDTTTDLESYVEITPSQTVERGRFKVDLSGQRIVILINPNDKPDIDRVRRDEDSLQALFPSMYYKGRLRRPSGSTARKTMPTRDGQQG